jgi:hypothetical protein
MATTNVVRIPSQQMTVKQTRRTTRGMRALRRSAAPAIGIGAVAATLTALSLSALGA